MSCCLTGWKYHSFILFYCLIEVGYFSNKVLAFLFLVFVWWGCCDGYAHRFQIRRRKKLQIIITLSGRSGRLLSIYRFWEEKIISTLSLKIDGCWDHFFISSHCSWSRNSVRSLNGLLNVSALDNFNSVWIKNEFLCFWLSVGDLFDLLEAANIYPRSRA